MKNITLNEILGLLKSDTRICKLPKGIRKSIEAEVTKAYIQGLLLRYRTGDYVEGYLDSMGLKDQIDYVDAGLMQKMKQVMPDNPTSHPETASLILKETKTYMNRWAMYYNLFKNAA